MNIVLKRIGKDFVFANCVNEEAVYKLIKADIVNYFSIGNNTYIVTNAEIEEAEINFGIIREDEDSVYSFIDFIKGDAVFVKKGDNNNLIDLELDDFEFINLNFSKNGLVNKFKNIKYDVLEIV